MYNHKYHYLYKITNNITDEYYYGVHSTDDLNDGYFGSGSALKDNIKNYGKNNFIKEIIGFFPNRKELMKAEERLVDEKLLNDSKCLNVILGGGELKGSVGCKCVIDENGKYIMIDKNNHEYVNFFTGRLCINKDGRMKYVYEYELNKYLEDGWEKGTIYNSPGKGKIWVCKDGSNRFIFESDLDKYLEDGWTKGMTNKNGVWVNKNGTVILIKKSEINKYLSEGWTKGTNKPTVNGKISIVKNGEIKYIHKDEYEHYLMDGWQRRSWKGFIWINKDGHNARVNTSELQQYLDNGWIKGKYGKSCEKKVYLYDLDWNLVETFEKTSDANKAGYNNIHKYCDTGEIYMGRFYISRYLKPKRDQ